MRPAELKGLVQRRLQRGKADASITLSGDAHAITRLEVDSEVAQQYVAAAEGLRQAGTVTGEIEISQLLALPGVTRFTEMGLPEDALKAAALTAMGSALDALDEMRLREGGFSSWSLPSKHARSWWSKPCASGCESAANS